MMCYFIFSAPKCQDRDWIFHNGFCYYISPDYGKKSSLNWFESRRICQAMGGDLASINTENDNNFLLTMVQPFSLYYPYHFFYLL